MGCWGIQRGGETFQLVHDGSLSLNDKLDEAKLSSALDLRYISSCWDRQEVTNGKQVDASKNRHLPHLTICQVFSVCLQR